MTPFPRNIALRYLWSRRGEAFISVLTVISILGIAVGVAVLNIVMSIMTGFEYELKTRLLGANSHVIVRNVAGALSDWERMVAKTEEVPGVQSVNPFTYNQALLRSKSHSSGLLLRGVAPGSDGAKQVEDYLQATDREFRFSLGVPADGIPPIVLGEEFMRSAGLIAGDIISLLAPQVQSSPFGLIPRYKRFRVVGPYRSGLAEYEGSLGYLSLADAQRFFELGSRVSGLEVRVNDVDLAPKIARAVAAKLSEVAPGVYVQDWTELNRGLWDAMRLEKSAQFAVLLLIVIMASFSIVSTLVMIVIEKRRDICILRTLGAKARDVSRIFRIQGAVIGATGTVLGVLLGISGCILIQEYGFPLPEKIFPVSTLPVRMEAMNFVVTAAASFAISLLATIYPAYRAGRIQPAEGLRYE